MNIASLNSHVPLTAYTPTARVGPAASTTTGNATIGTYDFTHMSPAQLGDTVNQLLKQGKMTADQSTALAGMVMLGRDIAQYNGAPPASFYQPTNVLQNLQTQQQSALARGDATTLSYINQALGILNQLQGTPSRFDLYA